MAEGYELDLTYVTERIICVSFPQDGSEEVYLRDLRDVTRMLRSKHADTYLVINLSERKQELRKMNPKTLDAGWPDLHAPPLDKICTICKAMEKWLNAAPLHVVVIHCRGGKGRIGVVISSFVHFTDVSASADQALDRFAMRRFYEDKVSALMTPSQKRYVWILRSLLSGSVKMNTSAAFLHCVCVREVPVGASQLYVKVYQGMQVVHVSGFHHVSTGHRGRIFFILDPAQPLKGDVMVKCFQLSSLSVRRLMFRVQFHIGTVQSCSLEFQRDQMDQVHPDCRFPASASVELLLSDGPEQMSGSEYWNNGPGVTVDYTNTDPLSRCDSYQNICGGEAPSVPRAQPEESRSRESESPAGWGPETPSSAPEGSCVRGGLAPRTSSPDHTLFSSSDSGLSSTSLRTDSWSAAGPRGPQPSRQEKMELRRMLSGFGLEEPAQDQASLPPPPDQFQENGQPRPRERETDILDDEALSCHHDLRSTDSLGTLSSSYHKSSQNSLLSDGLTEDTPQGHSEYGRRAGVTQKTQTFQQGGYPTQSWVHQQQLQYPYLPEEDLHPLKSASPPHKSHDEEFSSLTLDIDNSIRQLNQLILDLDPTLVSSTAQPERTLMGTGDWRVRAARALPREEDVLLSKNRTDVAELSGQSFWAAGQRFSNTCVTHADLYRTDDAEDDGIDVMMPSTPAFPTSPRTPYVRNVVNFSSYTPQSRSCAAEEDQDDVTGFPRVMRTADSSSSDPDLSRCLSGSLTFSARSLPVPELFTSSAGFQRVPSDGENSQNSSRSNSSLSAPFPCSVSEQPTPAHASRPSLPLPDVLSSRQLTVKFVQDTSRYWYKPGISRDQAIAVLKERAPGSFMVRDSHSFRGAYGLAVKVSTPPASTLPSRRGADPSCELVRHFLIECTQKGVRLKGCPTEPFFGSLSALVYQHSISALALPCKLLLPDRDPLEDAVDVGSSSSVSNSAAELLKQGAACNVWFLGSVEMESLTGSQAVLKAVDQVLGGDSSALSTLVHFKVSTQGITLTDNQRKLFFRRHYSVSTVIYCGLDPQDRRWKTDSDALAKIFGFVARKTGRGAENVCHLFGELDPEQPASAIVNFISRVMMGQKP